MYSSKEVHRHWRKLSKQKETQNIHKEEKLMMNWYPKKVTKNIHYREKK